MVEEADVFLLSNLEAAVPINQLPESSLIASAAPDASAARSKFFSVSWQASFCPNITYYFVGQCPCELGKEVYQLSWGSDQQVVPDLSKQPSTGCLHTEQAVPTSQRRSSDRKQRSSDRKQRSSDRKQRPKVRPGPMCQPSSKSQQITGTPQLKNRFAPNTEQGLQQSSLLEQPVLLTTVQPVALQIAPADVHLVCGSPWNQIQLLNRPNQPGAELGTDEEKMSSRNGSFCQPAPKLLQELRELQQHKFRRQQHSTQQPGCLAADSLQRISDWPSETHTVRKPLVRAGHANPAYSIMPQLEQTESAAWQGLPQQVSKPQVTGGFDIGNLWRVPDAGPQSQMLRRDRPLSTPSKPPSMPQSSTSQMLDLTVSHLLSNHLSMPALDAWSSPTSERLVPDITQVDAPIKSNIEQGMLLLPAPPTGAAEPCHDCLESSEQQQVVPARSKADRDTEQKSATGSEDQNQRQRRSKRLKIKRQQQEGLQHCPEDEGDDSLLPDPLRTGEECQAGFICSATLHLLRKLYCENSDAEGGNSDLSVTRRALNVERKRQKLLRQQVMEGMQSLSHQYSLCNAREQRMKKLLEDLERLRQGTVALCDRLPDVIQTVEDLNNLRHCEADSQITSVGIKFGRRCAAISPYSSWEQQQGVVGDPSISQALQFAGGKHLLGQACFRFSGASFAGKQGTLQQIAKIDRDSYRRLYAEYISTIQSELIPQIDGVDAAKAEEANCRTCRLIRELMTVDHLFFREHPKYYEAADAWAVADPIVPQAPLYVYEEVVAAARFSEEQLGQLWGFWDARNQRLQELECNAGALRSNVLSVLQRLQQERQENDYSELMQAVADMRDNLDETAVTNSVAISNSIFTVLSPLQAARMMAASYPYIINVPVLYEKKMIRRPVYG